MQTYAILALAAAGYASAQGVAAGTLLPTSSAPAGCSLNYASKFEITVVQAATMKRDVEKRQSSCASSGVLVASLANGVLTDSAGRIGGIVANRQFQFDGPPSQTGTIYNGGFSVCNNGSLALGGSNVFYQCLSGGFYNLYDQAVAAQCQQVLIDVIPCSGSVSSAATSAATSAASSAATPAASGVSSASVSVVAQSADGQVTGASATTTRAPATTVVSQITDGQIQASSAGPKPVSQYSDGQIQVTGTPAVVTAAPKTSTTSSAAKAPVSQISDGQIQATSAATRAASTLTAATNATASATRATYTGAANLASFGAEVVVGAAAVAAFALL